jgi:hypothetical protein
MPHAQTTNVPELGDCLMLAEDPALTEAMSPPFISLNVYLTFVCPRMDNAVCCPPAAITACRSTACFPFSDALAPPSVTVR